MIEDVPLQPPEKGYLHVLRVRALLFWLPLLLGSLVVDRLVLADRLAAGALPALIAMVAALAIFVAPSRIYRRLGWRADGEHLQVVRGWLVHVDTVVPFVRVQHIDVSRAPLDKLFGTATLVIHTAGTHNSIIPLPGLSPERADALRSTIRATIRSDLV
jgi:uncharacterized protein